MKAIRLMPSPKQAANAGRSRQRPLRPDWEAVKDEIMRKAVLKKFQTHQSIRETLLATGDEELIEKTTGDYYWGCGANGTGKNMLGIILMETRSLLAPT
ncbi:MAG: NADAR family protein [Meiothermus sp.]|nr:NADAR family protein [Meiothermus sp.]